MHPNWKKISKEILGKGSKERKQMVRVKCFLSGKIGRGGIKVFGSVWACLELLNLQQSEEINLVLQKRVTHIALTLEIKNRSEHLF